MISRRHILAIASAAGIGVAASACRSVTPKGDSGSAAASPASDQGGASDAGEDDPNLLDAVTVEGSPGEEPSISLAGPVEFSEYHTKVIEQGSGEKVQQGSTVVTRAAMFDPSSGEMLASRWDDGSVGIIPVSEDQIGPDAAQFFGSLSVGTRYLMAGMAQAQPVLEVGDIVGLPLLRAEGEGKDVPAPLPSVTLGEDGAPKLDAAPSEAAPTTLTEAVSIEGNGDTATEGDTLVMHYTGWDWESGEQFDSSWDRGTPFSFRLGKGEVIQGWDTSLEGKKAGSQVVMAIPPAQGYGEEGDHQLAGKTLLFVADILFVAKPPASA